MRGEFDSRPGNLAYTRQSRLQKYLLGFKGVKEELEGKSSYMKQVFPEVLTWLQVKTHTLRGTH